MAHIIFSEGSGVVDSKFGKVQTPIKMIIKDRVEAFEANSMIPTLFKEIKSNHWAENYRSDTAMDNWEAVGENGDHPTNGYEEAFDKTIPNTTWKSQFSISREIMDDSVTNELQGRPAKFATAYMRTREIFAAQLYGNALKGNASFKNGVYTFDTKTADGQNLFSKTHRLSASSKTVSNMFADAASNDAILYMESAMQDFRDDNGNILDIRPDTILIPNDAKLKKDILGAIGAEQDPDVSASNAFNINYGRWNVVIWPYLNEFVTAGTHPYIMLDSQYNKNYGGAIFQNRVGMEVTSKVEDNDANTWKGYARFGGAFVDFRFAAIGGVSGGTQLISG